MIAEACAGLDAQLVIALGRKNALATEQLPGDPIVVGYAPQLALLKSTSLVITHGGLNTTLECLKEGLPLIALPVTNEQPGIASRIKHLGLGEFIPIKNLTAMRLRNTICHVLSSQSYREQSLQRAKELQGLNGQSIAAQLIETAFTTREKVIA